MCLGRRFAARPRREHASGTSPHHRGAAASPPSGLIASRVRSTLETWAAGRRHHHLRRERGTRQARQRVCWRCLLLAAQQREKCRGLQQGGPLAIPTAQEAPRRSRAEGQAPRRRRRLPAPRRRGYPPWSALLSGWGLPVMVRGLAGMESASAHFAPIRTPLGGKRVRSPWWLQSRLVVAQAAPGRMQRWPRQKRDVVGRTVPQR
jgi:hypothetical protein